MTTNAAVALIGILLIQGMLITALYFAPGHDRR